MSVAETERLNSYTWPTEGNCRVPFWVYTDPGVYKLEQELIFRGSTWNYVGLEAEIPNPGDFKTTYIGDTSVIVVRDEEDSINALVNKCGHRGARVCRTACGNTTDFTCLYHQWNYDFKGNLLGVPFRRGVVESGRRVGGMPEDFQTAEHGLRKLKVDVHNGVIFASLTLLHVFLVTFGLFRADQKSKVEMDDTGMHAALVSRRGDQKASEGTVDMSNFKADYSLQDPSLLANRREFKDENTVVMQTIFPNLIVQQQTNTLALRQIVTKGPGHFELVWDFFGYEGDDEVMTGYRLKQANLMGPSGLVSIDDAEAMEMAQRGCARHEDDSAVMEMGGREWRDEDHMVTETAIRGFYNYYRQLMGFN